MVVAQSLINEIEEKRNKITNDPDYFLKRARRIRADIRKLADVYSFWLENPELRGRVLRFEGVQNTRDLRHHAKIGVEHIKEAWDFLARLQYSGNFIGNITPSLIIDVGRIVVPEYNTNGFRTEGHTSMDLKDYVPPNPLNISTLIEKLCEDLRRSDYWPVEAAAVTHLGMVSIQPFRDGNKRTARLFQDRILSDYGLPPAVIPSGEREVYIDLLEQGMIGARDGNLKAQRPFFDYIAGKVNVALDEILNDLNVTVSGRFRNKLLGH